MPEGFRERTPRDDTNDAIWRIERRVMIIGETLMATVAAVPAALACFVVVNAPIFGILKGLIHDAIYLLVAAAGGWVWHAMYSYLTKKLKDA